MMLLLFEYKQQSVYVYTNCKQNTCIAYQYNMNFSFFYGTLIHL